MHDNDALRRRRALREAINDWLTTQSRPALPPPAQHSNPTPAPCAPEKFYCPHRAFFVLLICAHSLARMLFAVCASGDIRNLMRNNYLSLENAARGSCGSVRSPHLCVSHSHIAQRRRNICREPCRRPSSQRLPCAQSWGPCAASPHSTAARGSGRTCVGPFLVGTNSPASPLPPFLRRTDHFWWEALATTALAVLAMGFGGLIGGLCMSLVGCAAPRKVDSP